MIKIIDIWDDNFQDFFESIKKIDSIEAIIFDCLHEVEFLESGNLQYILDIADYANNKKIPVKVLTPNFKPKKIPYENVEYFYWETFWFSRTYRAWAWDSNHKFNLQKNVDITDLRTGKNFNILYPYICLNNISKDHRSLVIDLLAKHDILNKGKVSWRNEIRSQNGYNYNYKYWTPTKLILDQDTDNQFKQETMPIEFNHSFMQLVTESQNEVTYFSEKTATPIFLNKPFLAAANVGFHSDLKRLGFELYDELFDYSFDVENDNETRYEMLIENVKRYATMDAPALQEKYNRVFEKLVKNKNLAMSYVKYVPKEVYKLYRTIQEKNIDYRGALNIIEHLESL